jgi:type I restriction enzyme S subunit
MRDDWTVTTIGAVTTHFRGTVKVEDGVSYPASGVMMEGRGLIDREPFIGGISGYKKLTPITPGQLVLRSITAWEAPITVVPVGYIGRHVSGVFPVLNLDEGQVNPGFMRLICQWPVFWNEMRMRATGSVLRRKTLSASQLQQIPINLPPLVEQKRIVDVVASVDAYIDALQKQADTARTARNAVMHELLSARGDDWSETTVGGIAEVVGGGTPSTTNPTFWGGEVIWLTPSEVSSMDGKVIKDSIRKISDAGLRGSGARLLPVGTVILTSRASVGFVALAGVELTTNQGFQSLIPSKSVLSRFLMYWIQQNRYEFESRSAGSTFKEISKSNVKSIPLDLPPLAEQGRIVEIVSSMDDVIQSTEKAVVDAKSLRSGLLSDLLSGEHEIPASYDSLLGAA